ncbi:MAG: hypothetical protein PX638_03005 [Microcystis sp. M53599_WE4]|nr:hypothetical protein [Microcystis sp. M53599_WE4]
MTKKSRQLFLATSPLPPATRTKWSPLSHLPTPVHLFSENSRGTCKYLLQRDEEKSDDRDTRKD